MTIDFKEKFVGDHISTILLNDWDKSFSEKLITFNLKKLEWISISGISCFFSWIIALQEDDPDRRVEINLQSSKDVLSSSDEFNRRQTCLGRLLVDWDLESILSAPNALIFDGISSVKKYEDNLSNFSRIPIIRHESKIFDNDFDVYYEKFFKELNEQLKLVLSTTDINYYDSEFLNYSLLKELYSNSCLHSFSEKTNNCFFSIGLNRKFSGNSKYVSDKRIEELSELEFDYFTENKKYRNINYFEFNFHDYGIGIAQSLKDKYEKETESDLKIFFGEKYYKNFHSKCDLDTRIIEYGLLLFTSRHELERNFEVHDYIPRGLFILKDIVRKYHGYIEIISNGGALSIGYKNGKTSINHSSSELFFPGTQVKIIFPSMLVKPSSLKSIISSRKEFENKKWIYQNINFLKEFSKVELTLKDVNLENPETYKNKLTGLLFSEFFNLFKNITDSHIFMIDFAGIEPSTIDLFNKFIYFINHVPITGNGKLIIYNITTSGLNATITNNKLKSKGFSAYPIPCINVNLDIQWLGVSDNFTDSFSEIWRGSDSKEYTYENVVKYKANIININSDNGQYKVEIHLPVFREVLDEIENQIENQIDQELKNNGIQFSSLKDGEEINYNNIILSDPEKSYLSPSGNFMKEYISFNEKLYILPFRRMLACYLLFKTYKHKEQSISKLNKILTVTLSGQLIGVEFKDIFNRFHDKSIDLIALSSYYNFQKEEGFKSLDSKDKVLILTDVISTGSLLRSIIKELELNKIKTIGSSTVIDLRKSKPSEIPVLSISKYSIEYYDSAQGNDKVEIINHVLNVPVDIQRNQSRENVLYSKEDFFNLFDEKYLIIGNLRSSSVYFNYFPLTSDLLEDDRKNGFPFLNDMLLQLSNLKKKKRGDELNYLLKGIDVISKNISDSIVTSKLSNLSLQLKKINQKIVPSLFKDDIDIVFYPFLSDISIIEDNAHVFINQLENSDQKIPLIFPIPRIMTSRGWRFSFPPKFMSVLIKENRQTALIIDDGSLTGDTIMQMIDSISFLAIKSIDVFSLFSRLEDFKKDFYSRIKSIQVKGSVVPINVFFGSHFNIPVYNYIENPTSVEFQEIELLERELKEQNIAMSDMFEAFIKERKDVLAKAVYPSLNVDQTPLFDSVSKKQVFFIRDSLGRFDTYRMYSDDIPNNDMGSIIEKNEDILTLLTVLNLEPRLYDSLKRVFSKEKITELIKTIKTEFLSKSQFMNEEWKREFFIKSLFNLSTRGFFKPKNLLFISEKLMKYDDSVERKSLLYLEYLIIKVKLGIKTIDDKFVSKSFENNIDNFLFNLRKNNKDLWKELRFAFKVFNSLVENDSLDFEFRINKYYKLRQYYSRVALNEKEHDDILLTNVFSEFTKKISELKYSINFEISEDIEKNIEFVKIEKNKLATNYTKHMNFKFIREIVNDLKKHSNTDLPISIDILEISIKELEHYIIEDFNYKEENILKKIEQSIDNYKKNILEYISPFAEYIKKSHASLLDEWKRAEATFLKDFPNSKLMDVSECENIEVNVNPYALGIAFNNILTNKKNHSNESSWKMTINKYNEYDELIIIQNSKFENNKGDGTGQSTIKSILRNYGVYYEKISDYPYTLQLTFIKND